MAADSSGNKVFKWLFGRTKGLRLRLTIISITNLIYAVISVMFALFCRGIIDSAVSGSKEEFAKYSLYLIGTIIAQLLLRLIASFFDEQTRSEFEIRMRADIISQLMKADFSQICSTHSGELLNRIFSDVAVAADGVVSIVPAVINCAARIICAAAVLIVLDSRFFIVFMAGGIVIFLSSLIFRSRMKKLHTEVQEKEGLMRSVMQETVENLLTIKTFGVENKMLSLVNNKQNEHYSSKIKRRCFSIAAGAGLDLAFSAGYVFAIIWGSYGIFTSVMTYGTLTAVLQLVGQLQSPFSGLSSMLPKYYGMIASSERIIELTTLPEEPLPEKKLSYDDLEKISFSDVCFSYGENKVIRNATFDIDKGSITSLTGISGGGKSTLFLMLMGIYQNQSGVLCFRTAGESYSPGRETRSLFAYVPQGNRLFSGTISDNVSMLAEDPSEEEIMSALKIACADKFIAELPQGLNTPVGEKGFGLSEGQAQRIAIARAILSRAPILLLDEATSALDEETEAQLLENIKALQNKTVLIVTHRPAALKICNRHLILNEGVISYE